jgi:hypothetical protein
LILPTDPVIIVGGQVTSVVLVAFALLFLGVVIYSSFRFRHLTLATTAPLPGEAVHFEDEAARFSEQPYHAALVTSLTFLRAVVRVTNRRVLIAQPALLSRKQRVIRFAVFTSPVPPELGDPLRDGYVTFSTAPDHVSVVEHRGRRVLRIVPTDPGFTKPQYVLLESPRLDEYWALLSNRGAG